MSPSSGSFEILQNTTGKYEPIIGSMKYIHIIFILHEEICDNELQTFFFQILEIDVYTCTSSENDKQISFHSRQ